MKAFPYTGAGTDGMDLRDYFAAKALQGYLSVSEVTEAIAEGRTNSVRMAKACYAWADAMMTAREGGQDE
jgi:hypothetical protein